MSDVTENTVESRNLDKDKMRKQHKIIRIMTQCGSGVRGAAGSN